MRSLTLDFLHPLPRPHWAAWVLLAAGMGLAAWVGWQGRQAQSALDQTVAAAPRMAPAAARRPQRATTAGEEQSVARQAGEQLATPWGNLFVRLEANRPKRIALVALEADARKPEATLTAEARSAKDMLAYIEQLKGKAGFTSVTLASHAVQEGDPQRPLRFVVRLVWKA
jgi:Tfp pilus assembly protein PilN